jgi:2-aminoadipate transaminase
MGYLVGDAGIVKQMHDWAVDTYIGPVTPTQGMVYEYFKAGKLEPNIRRLCDLYRPRLDAMIAAVDHYLPGSVYPRPEGGFFVGVTLPDGNCMDELLPKADKAGLKLTDGRGFFLNSVDGDRFLRLPFCSLTPDEIESAIQILARLVVK